MTRLLGGIDFLHKRSDWTINPRLPQNLFYGNLIADSRLIFIAQSVSARCRLFAGHKVVQRGVFESGDAFLSVCV